MDSPPESPESPRQESESESESLVEWEDSASPEEDWGDDVDEWPIKGIVGEEVTTSGDTRCVDKSFAFGNPTVNVVIW